MSDKKPTFQKITGLSVFRSDTDVLTKVIGISVQNNPIERSFAKIIRLLKKSVKKSSPIKSMMTPTETSRPFSRLVWPRVVNLLIFWVYITASTKLRSLFRHFVISATSGIMNTKIFAKISRNRASEPCLRASSSGCSCDNQKTKRNFLRKKLIFR